MAGYTSSLNKVLVLALPLIGIGLVELIQGQENWNNGGNNSMDSVANLSARIFKDSGNGSAPIAYHRSLHNVSWAVTIPLFSFLLPTAGSGDPLNIANQASYGVFAAVVTIISFGIPILFNGAIPGQRSLDNSRISLDHLLHPGHVVNSFGVNFQNQIGIDPTQCLQKTICQAHRSPQNQRYGILAQPIQYIFPAHKDAKDSARSIYLIAAREGRYKKTDCGRKYECMFDVLDLASYFLAVYKRAKERAAGESLPE